MVVACTLAITPAVSAEGEITITAGDVTGDIGDIVTVPLVVTGTPDEEGIEWNSIAMVIYANDAMELLYALDLEGSQIDLGSGKLTNKYAADANPSEIRAHDYYKFAAMNPDNGNWYTGEGESVLNLVYQIKGFVKSDIVVDVEAWDTLTEQGGVQIANNFVPGTISVDGGFEKYLPIGDEVTVSDELGGYASITTTADKNKFGSTKGQKRTRTISLQSSFEGNTVLLNNDVVYAYDSVISQYYELPEDGNISHIGTANSTTFRGTLVSNTNNLVAPENVYLAADFTAFDSIYFSEYVAYGSANIYLLGEYSNDDEENADGFTYDLTQVDDGDGGYYYQDTTLIDSLIRIDPDADYGDDGAMATMGTLNVWNGGFIWEMFEDDSVRSYVEEMYGEATLENLNIKPIDNFDLIGYQGPAEVTNKKFRVDSAIKYADTQFTVDEEPKNIYDTASCNITVKGKAGGANIDKKYTANIGTVYKSLSGVNGVAVPACDGYYFSALAISDLPELSDGETLTFTFTNTVTNIFGGETTSEPVSLTYHADGSITQE